MPVEKLNRPLVPGGLLRLSTTIGEKLNSPLDVPGVVEVHRNCSGKAQQPLRPTGVVEVVGLAAQPASPADSLPSKLVNARNSRALVAGARAFPAREACPRGAAHGWALEGAREVMDESTQVRPRRGWVGWTTVTVVESTHVCARRGWVDSSIAERAQVTPRSRSSPATPRWAS